MNYKAKSKLVLLAKHIATGTAASYIYTPSAPILPSEYSSIKIVIIGAATAALELQLIINSDETGAWYQDGLSAIGGTLTAIDLSGVNQAQLISANLITAALQFQSITELIIPDASMPNDQIAIFNTSRAQATGAEITNGMFDVNYNSITEIEIQTSTSTWIAGTQITIYGILK